jgi:hypothetical protein
MTRHWSGVLAACAAVCLWGTAAQAQTNFNANSDFSLVNGNPNGVWTYGFGYAQAGGALLNAPTTSFLSVSGVHAWLHSTVNTAGTPSILKNMSGATQFGVPTGFLSLHPGTDHNAYLRFTAPFTGSYAVNAQFFAGDAGQTTADIFGNFTGSHFSTSNTGTNPAYSGTISLNAGWSLYFLVDKSTDGFGADSTPLTVNIAGTAAPEPSSLALLALGALSVIRRRKAA